MKIDLVGHVYGRLTVEEEKGKTKHGHLLWKCLCECGNTIVTTGQSLRKGDTKSCGCYKLECSSKALKDYYKHLRNTVYGCGPLKELFSTYRKGARGRELGFELSLIQFENLINGNCHYCGIEPKQKRKRYNDEIFVYNGIDRLDNSIGYFLSNCVSCCKVCNKSKNNMSLSEFRDWIDRLIVFNRK